MAYYKADRLSSVSISSNIEHVALAPLYSITDRPGQQLVKYMVNLKTTQAFALQKGDQKRAKEIEGWFDRFEQILNFHIWVSRYLQEPSSFLCRSAASRLTAVKKAPSAHNRALLGIL